MEIVGLVAGDPNGITTPGWIDVTDVQMSSSGYNTSGSNTTSLTATATNCSLLVSELAAFKDTP